MHTKTIKSAEEHIKIVSRERNYKRKLCKDTKDEIKSIFTSDDQFKPPPVTSSFAAMSLSAKVHYSFDMAQQIIKIIKVDTLLLIIVTYILVDLESALSK